MTDIEIKNALQLHQHDVTFCKYCPYESKGCEEKMCEDALNLIDKLQAENERLTHITRNLVGEIKAEAYTEFAEKCKEKFKEYWYDYDIRVFCDEVDNLLKEMIGE